MVLRDPLSRPAMGGENVVKGQRARPGKSAALDVTALAGNHRGVRVALADG